MMRRSPFLAIAATAALALTACGDTGDGEAAPEEAAPEEAASEEATVTIDTFIFAPDPLTVAAGTEVTFENLDGTIHTATAGTREAPDPDTFDIELAGGGQTLSITLDEPGTYAYFCTIHSGEGMTGEIVVE
jgi:plastocyanin